MANSRDMRLRLLVVGVPLALTLALAFPAWASAGWAGSRYERSDCVRTHSGGGRPGLRCERWFTDLTPGFVADEIIEDAECENGLRRRVTTGTLVTRYRGWDVYSGPVPIYAFAVVGNEDSHSFGFATDAIVEDLGCY